VIRFLRLFPDFRAMEENLHAARRLAQDAAMEVAQSQSEARRAVELQDQLNDLESQNALLKEQLAQSRMSETDAFKKLANVLSQLQFRVRLFPEVDGLPESQIQPEDMKPIANQHSFLTAINEGRRQTRQDWDSYWTKANAQLEAIKKQQEAKLAQQQPKKTLDELAQESFAR
jgi:hypothetical protein